MRCMGYYKTCQPAHNMGYRGRKREMDGKCI